MEEIHYLLGNSCNLNCDFCFWDKRLPTPSIEITNKIIEEIIALGVKRVTISGGEPTISPYLIHVLTKLKEAGIETVVHTNGLIVDEDNARILASLVSRVSLSLDGSTSEMSANMRKNQEYVNNTIGLIDYFTKASVPTSVKTLVTKVNYKDIMKIGKILSLKPIKYWSLLEFNPINRGKIYRDKFYLSDEEFDSVVDEAKKGFPELTIKIRRMRREPENYRFITSNGEVWAYDSAIGDTLIGDVHNASLSSIL